MAHSKGGTRVRIEQKDTAKYLLAGGHVLKGNTVTSGKESETEIYKLISTRWVKAHLKVEKAAAAG
eukprot:14003152-Heterocapsa_arctica.AAC.1